ncbi:MAG: CHRD domain-containing protein [Proteobacteria bacterium]|nr:CHRD domain-containing protein [Burkholderiales bacterium]
MTMLKSTIKCLAAASLLAVASAHAITVNVFLSGAQETIPNPSLATGNGTFTLNPDNTISFNVVFAGLTPTLANGAPSALTISHIHNSATPGVGLPGTNAPVVIDIVGGVPPAGVSGPLPGVSAGVLVGNNVVVSNAFLTGLSLGNAYFNVHSNLYPGGEIRGQIAALVNTSVIPVPAALPLMLGGLLLIGAQAVRGRSKRV